MMNKMMTMGKTVLACGLVSLLMIGCAPAKATVTKASCTADIGGVATKIEMSAPSADADVNELNAVMTLPASFVGMETITDEMSAQKETFISMMSGNLGIPAENIDLDFGEDSFDVKINLKSTEEIRNYLEIGEDESLKLEDVKKDLEEADFATCE